MVKYSTRRDLGFCCSQSIKIRFIRSVISRKKVSPAKLSLKTNSTLSSTTFFDKGKKSAPISPKASSIFDNQSSESRIKGLRPRRTSAFVLCFLYNFCFFGFFDENSELHFESEACSF